MPDPVTRQLDWMDNAENMRPLRGGRPAASVLASANPTVTVDEARTKFEIDFKAAESADDPLDLLVKFVKWFQWSFPTGRVDVLQPMVYRIVTKYGTDPRYKNDERTMKLWLTMADNFPERGFAVMDLACNRGSCAELAKFYIFWSRMYEYAENMTKAREVLQRGINNGAAPITELHTASDALEVRIFKWTMEKDQNQLELDMDDDSFIDHDIERMPFNELDQIEHANGAISAPVLRVVSYPPPQNVTAKSSSAPAGDFDIYCDSEEEEPIPLPQEVKRKEFDQLAMDPDYQSIFGYKEFTNIHINIAENAAKSGSSCGGGIPGLNTSEQPLAGFVVYCEKEKAQKMKLKFAMRRELVEVQSIEEAFLQRLETIQNASGDQ